MKRILLASVFGLAVLGLSAGTALAQAKGKGKGKAQPESAKGYQKVKTYDFSGDTIDGELVKPEGEFLNARGFAQHTSLIKVRQDFIREILKSAEDL